MGSVQQRFDGIDSGARRKPQTHQAREEENNPKHSKHRLVHKGFKYHSEEEEAPKSIRRNTTQAGKSQDHHKQKQKTASY